MKASDKAKAAREDLHERDLIAQQLAGRAFIRFDRKIDYDAWARAAIGPDGEPVMTSMTLRDRMRNPGRLSFEEMAALAAPLGVKVKVELYAAAQD